MPVWITSAISLGATIITNLFGWGSKVFTAKNTPQMQSQKLATNAQSEDAKIDAEIADAIKTGKTDDLTKGL